MHSPSSIGPSLLGLALAGLAACAQTSPSDASAARGAPPHQVLVTGGTIRVGAPDWRVVEAMLCEDGVVVALGGAAELAARAGQGCERIDLHGATAVPGLIDAHGHLEGLGKDLEEIELRGLASYAAVIERVVARAATLPPGTWVEGRGWDQNLWEGGAFPTHGALSAAVPDHPVALRRIDGHALLANARALELAGLTGPQSSESSVPGGRVVLLADGRPSGVLVDNAMDLVTRHIPAPSAEVRERRVRLAARALAAEGLTVVHDMGEDLELARLLARLSARGELDVEVVGYLSEGELQRDLARELASLPRATRDASSTFRVAGVKLYMDGALGSRGAALLEPYADDPTNVGLPFLTEAELDARLARCDELRLQPAIHAIGDLANRRVLDAYERRMGASRDFASLRPRIEHAQVVAPEDWTRFAALGVIPSMQPTHATSDMPWAPARLGARRVEGAYAWRRLDPTGTRLACGSDFPVERSNPLEGLYAAITCADAAGNPPGGYRPDQKLDAKAALAGFTLNAAHAAREETRLGKLEVGCHANLTVLDVDPLTCDPRALLGAGRVLRTIVRGRTTFVRAAAEPAARSAQPARR